MWGVVRFFCAAGCTIALGASALPGLSVVSSWWATEGQMLPLRWRLVWTVPIFVWNVNASLFLVSVALIGVWWFIGRRTAVADRA
jgi:hypothetical protein